MPSPPAHAIGGLLAAFLVDSIRRRPLLTPTLLAASALVAMAPDLDLLAGTHRTYTHSIGAVFIVGTVGWLVAAVRGRVRDATRAAAILAAAHGSHLVLDWLSMDTSTPSGVMLAWPFSSEFYVSGWNVFYEVSRRYWRPEEFVVGNLMALMWELTLLVPVLLFAWAAWSKRTVDERLSTGD